MSSSITQQTSSSSCNVREKVPTGRLFIFNNLNKKKELFVPVNGNQVKWFSPGPSIYEKFHIGYMRHYVTLDILRRIIEKYFGYDIIYCTNMNDINDEINKWCYQPNVIIENMASDEIREDLQASFKKPFDNTCVIPVTRAKSCISHATNTSSTNYSKRFIDRAKQLEEMYKKNMRFLNILPPTIGVRFSDYIPNIIQFIEKIMENRFAYESNSSVYFDTVEFHKQYPYTNFEFNGMDDVIVLREGEPLTTLKNVNKEKKTKSDFLLWQKQKSDETIWPSPWGFGRPGPHIECSVIETTALGSQVTIYTGGFGLKSIHHNSDLAQLLTYNGNDSLTYIIQIGGSSSDQNEIVTPFNTIDRLVNEDKASLIRLLCLLHPWGSTLDFSNEKIQNASIYGNFINDFINNVGGQLHFLGTMNLIDPYDVLTGAALNLSQSFSSLKQKIDLALCDNIDLPSVMEHLHILITITKEYMKQDEKLHVHLVQNIYSYVSHLIEIFGLK